MGNKYLRLIYAEIPESPMYAERLICDLQNALSESTSRVAKLEAQIEEARKQAVPDDVMLNAERYLALRNRRNTEIHVTTEDEDGDTQYLYEDEVDEAADELLAASKAAGGE